MMPTEAKIELQPLELKGLSLIRAIFEFGRTPLKFHRRCAEEYGNVVCLNIAGTKTYLFNHPALIDELLNKQEPSCIKDYSYRALEDVFGEGLLLSHGDTWKTHRRLIQWAFSRDRLNIYGRQIAKHTDSMLKNWRSGEVCDVQREMSLLTVKIIMQAMFEVDATQSAATIIDALDTIIFQYLHRTENWYLLPNWLPTLENWRAYRAKQKLDELVYEIIAQRQKLPQNDLLSMLDGADNVRLSDKQLRDEVLTLLIAGHETTASLLTWTMMLLAQHPEVEAKLVAEVRSVLGEDLPTVEDRSRLKYTEMVLKESMRLYPPAWNLGRELIRDCNIGGYNLDRGTVIYFSQWAIHRDARFFPEPERFNPDRWQDNLEQRLPRCAYFPFGAGARVCIGKALSMMEATLILATIVRQFRLTLVCDRPIEPLPSFTLRPKNGLLMNIVDAQSLKK